MPDNKDQHYLPKHYLRYFSTDGGGKNIGVARIDPFKFVIGSIAGQCQENWFYANDGELDEWLKETESYFGSVFPEIFRLRRIKPTQIDACRMAAVVFSMRTKKAAFTAGGSLREIFFEVVDRGIKNGDLPPPPSDWSRDAVAIQGMSGFLLKHNLFACYLEMWTLEVKLLTPVGGQKFITSDHPVSCLNELFAREAASTGRSYSGFSRSGFQLVFPINPTLCLFFYDPGVYKVGAKKQLLVPVPASDVQLINTLQVLNADKCIFTSESDIEAELKTLIKSTESYRERSNITFKSTNLNPYEKFMHQLTPNLQLPRKWSFCKLRRHTRLPNEKRRNPTWSRLITAFTEHTLTNPCDDMMMGFRLFSESYQHDKRH